MLKPLHRLLPLITLACFIAGAATLQNPAATWSFDDHGLADVNGTKARSAWCLKLQTADGGFRLLDPRDSRPAITVNGQTATLVWANVNDDATATRLTVTQSVTLRADGATAWTIAVEGTSQAKLYAVESPAITDIPATAIALPDGDGRLVADTKQPFTAILDYPEEASVQLIAAWNATSGFAVFAEDPAFFLKQLRASCADGVCALSIADFPPLPAENGKVAYKSSYPTVLASFKGDWQAAAERYAHWARPLAKPLTTVLAADAAWFQSQYEPFNAVRQWEAAARQTGKPVIAPYHSYTIAKNGYFFPDILPLDPYLRGALQTARRFGVTPTPVVSARAWDFRSDAWLSGTAKNTRVACADGTPADISGDADRRPAAALCAATNAWNLQLKRSIAILIEHGADAVVIENLLSPALRCHDASHGHPANGGDYAAKALRAALDNLRAEAQKANPRFALIVDGVSEALVGHADAFIAPKNNNAIPLFAAVYRDAAIVASPAAAPETTSKPADTGDTRLLLAQEDKFFPFVKTETADEIWGCDDAVVIRNPKKMHNMLKPSFNVAEFGIRKGPIYILPPSKETDGMALPAEWETQNFASLYKLPYTMKSKHLVFTMSGGDMYLALNCHTNDKNARFATDKKGVFAARLIADKETNPDGTFQFFKSPDELNAAFQAKEITAISSIGYAAFDDATLDAAVRQSAAFGLKTDNLAAAWKAMAAAPSLENLSTLNHEIHNWFLNANDCQQIFAPGAAGERLLRQAQALVTAAALTPNYMNQPMLAFATESIMPGTAQPVVTAFSHKKPETLLAKTTLNALGIKAPAVFTATPLKSKDDVHYPGFIVTLSNPPADLQSFTLAAWMPFTVQGVELLAMDLGWLTVAQPMKLFVNRNAVYVSPGCATTTSLSIQNASSSESIEYEAAVQVPEGWNITLEPKISKPELRKTAKVTILLKAPQELPSGHSTMTASVTGVGMKEIRQSTIIDLDCVLPPRPAAEPKAPSAEQELNIAGTAMLAFFLKNGDRYSIRLNNTSEKAVGWTLRNPAFENVRASSLPPNDSMKLNGTAIRDAAYYLSFTPADDGTVNVTCSTHALSRRASDATPAVVFEDDASFYFHVTGDFALQTKNAPDGAVISIISPTERTIVCEPNAITRVKTTGDENGKVWRIKLEKASKTALSITGGASPWLAQSPDSVLK